MLTEKQVRYFSDWKEREAIAEQMLPIIGRLYRDNDVVITIYDRKLVHQSTIDILRAHRFARQILENELSVRDTMPVLQAVAKLDLAPARIDIGKLTVRYQAQAGNLDIDEFVRQELKEINTGHKPILSEPRDVVLYGFGRIGRLLARILIDQTGGGNKLRLRAVVVRKGSEDDLVKRASLLRRDSVHGPFMGTIKVDPEENAIIANGNLIHVIYSNDPAEVDYARYGISNAILIDNTGKWRDREGLSQHLKSGGIDKVILTAPGKGDVPNIVYGINNNLLNDDERIFSAASCTTNAIVPVLKAVNDRFGIVNGHVETCHSYTNDQNLIDNYHKKSRRGRGAPLNMVITETGAAKAVAKALPELTGKLTGNAIRVPTPNVSLAILSLNLEKETSVEEINSYLREVSLEGPLHELIDYTNSPDVVSTDFVGSGYACVVDSCATIVQGNRCNLYVWYDNENGYSCQVVKMVDYLAGLKLPVLPA
ncbi:glyceraldehyde 3-phosphate dehydrogenase [Geothermobacter ehrlichii]|uniref:Glyceraldehyde-3-phosphate dehydrogenase n=1 Tax=Geothermobacter ehrlichii TaxID=213224 RepID=A0A5D3WG06_9BACT|nr:glyceraldehyde-3-phosphate dehydrogenase [Geothermobacter ehrlichii]TYO97085.1 glyceraldehyde 3-phosphate dehydrogenase [Geothermobacter ehrlichii]